ncbi:GNAT family N-acetyltransferase [Anaerosporobacter sp.]|uniref:GNAT family N-acetyltransferase n=1 Tax=Anaerosporobacter sp. TaxID=1872529 RepID=UPI00286EB8F0|nr:GNAT family protein [Anaerosporobacter sp.]
MKISLEKWKKEDYHVFFNASKDNALRENMSDTFPKTLEECKEIVHFFSTSTDTTEYIRAIKVDNQIVGCIAAFFEEDMYCKNAEISYWLSAEYRGKGIMSQVIETFTQALFSEFDIHRIWARPFERNKASQGVLKKVGFSYEGLLKQNVLKDGLFLDSVIYAFIKQ